MHREGEAHSERPGECKKLRERARFRFPAVPLVPYPTLPLPPRSTHTGGDPFQQKTERRASRSAALAALALVLVDAVADLDGVAGGGLDRVL